MLLAYAAANAAVIFLLPLLRGDAMAFAEWSKLIAATGHFHIPSGTELMYQRPLVYVLLGWAWRLFGIHESIARILSAGFGLLLVGTLLRLGVWLGKSSLEVGIIAAVLLFGVSAVPVDFTSCLTDLPTAALVAVAGVALLVVESPGWIARATAGTAACLAMLAKPSALAGIAGLAGAVLLHRGEEVRSRRVWSALALCAGCAVALAYDAREARALDMSLMRFLLGFATGGFYATLASQSRVGHLLAFDWLGPGLRSLLGFAVVYSALRLAGVRHRGAVWIAAPAAAVWMLLGAHALGTSEGIGAALSLDSLTAKLVMLGAWAAIGAAVAAAGESQEAVSRHRLLLLVVWALPTTAAWLGFAAYETRLLSPAWAPLVLLVVSPHVGILAGGSPWLRWCGTVAALGVAVVSAANLANVDGLGIPGWHTIAGRVAAGDYDRDSLRRTLLPDLMQTVSAVEPLAGARGRVFAIDGKLRFFFPGRAIQAYPRTCGELGGASAFVLLTDPDVQEYFTAHIGHPGTVEWFLSCRYPKMDVVAQFGTTVVFRIKQ